MAISMVRTVPQRPSAVDFAEERAVGKIIAVGNLKGGTGKSTTAVNLACAMASYGRSVCVVDCDPQETSFRWLAKGEHAIAAERMPVERISSVEGWMLKARRLVDEYDIVIVDLPAVVTPAVASAFLLAHVILIPVTPSAIDIDGTERVLRHVRMAREERPAAMPKVMLVPTRVDQLTLHRNRLPSRLAGLHERIGPAIRERATLAEAFEARRWVGSYAPDSAAHADIMVLEAAVSELLDHAPDPPLLKRFPEPLRRVADEPVREIPAVLEPELPEIGRRSWWRRLFGS
ncbi:MAG: ParA family protein [Geminicoccaceae bacterium]|nr:ParA family protein [Geminicoccaceae bacterium]